MAAQVRDSATTTFINVSSTEENNWRITGKNQLNPLEWKPKLGHFFIIRNHRGCIFNFGQSENSVNNLIN